ncbi:MAG: T3SS (YopN, CesT) and YbjN peptide-binding chaperone 1 [Candidatus Nanopelagicales bacterium]
MDLLHHDTVESVAHYTLFILREEFGDAVHIHDSLRYELPAGSTRVVTEVAGIAEHAVILVSAPLALNVPATPEMFEFVARQGGRPGLANMLVLAGDADGRVNVMVAHHIYGNCLDRAELLTSVANVAAQADGEDENFVARFGGTRLADAD